MRITVYDVLSYLAAGMTAAQILADFPYLTEEDIQACLAFAAERERAAPARTSVFAFPTDGRHQSPKRQRVGFR
jgi:hypothetical protein